MNEQSDIFGSFIIGKAGVAPLKMSKIPRLELTAALLSLKINKHLKTTFKYQINAEYFGTEDCATTLLTLVNVLYRCQLLLAAKLWL